MFLTFWLSSLALFQNLVNRLHRQLNYLLHELKKNVMLNNAVGLRDMIMPCVCKISQLLQAVAICILWFAHLQYFIALICSIKNRINLCAVVIGISLDSSSILDAVHSGIASSANDKCAAAFKIVQICSFKAGVSNTIPGGPQPCRVLFQPCSNTQTM